MSLIPTKIYEMPVDIVVRVLLAEGLSHNATLYDMIRIKNSCETKGRIVESSALGVSILTEIRFRGDMAGVW